ncbi:MAG: diacylglycerol kinase family protein [Myxococcota bacterium]
MTAQAYAQADPAIDLTRPIVAIINGAAGGGRCAARASAALRDLRRDQAIDMVTTEGPGHASELARAAFEDGARRFIAVGGDGTSYEVINGLFPRANGANIELGLLPLGTGNSFLRDFGVSGQDDALGRLARWATRPVDLVEATHQSGSIHYMNLLSIGFTADVGDLTNRRFKALGPAGYVAAVVSCLSRLDAPRDPIAIDDLAVDERKAVFMSFSNSQYTGGAMQMAPDADVSDGKLDVIRVGELGRADLLRTFPKIYAGTHVRHPQVETTRAQRVRFTEPRRQAVMVDGEVVELTLKQLDVRPHALRVVA